MSEGDNGKDMTHPEKGSYKGFAPKKKKAMKAPKYGGMKRRPC